MNSDWLFWSYRVCTQWCECCSPYKSQGLCLNMNYWIRIDRGCFVQNYNCFLCRSWKWSKHVYQSACMNAVDAYKCVNFNFLKRNQIQFLCIEPSDIPRGFRSFVQILKTCLFIVNWVLKCIFICTALKVIKKKETCHVKKNNSNNLFIYVWYVSYQ